MSSVKYNKEIINDSSENIKLRRKGINITKTANTPKTRYTSSEKIIDFQERAKEIYAKKEINDYTVSVNDTPKLESTKSTTLRKVSAKEQLEEYNRIKAELKAKEKALKRQTKLVKEEIKVEQRLDKEDKKTQRKIAKEVQGILKQKEKEKKRAKKKAISKGRYTSPKKNRSIINRIRNYHKVHDEYNFDYSIIKDDIKNGTVDLENDWELVQNYEDVLDDKKLNGVITSIRLGLCALGVAGIIAGGNAVKNEYNDVKNKIAETKANEEQVRNNLWRQSNIHSLVSQAEQALYTSKDNELLLSFYLHDNNIPTDENGKVALDRKLIITEDELQEYWENIPEEVREYIREPANVIKATGKYIDRDDITLVYNEREDRDER